MAKSSIELEMLPIKSHKNSFINMFCFPSSGGSASMYAHWDKYLPEWVSAIPVEYPGHGSRAAEKLIHDPDILVDDLLRVFSYDFDKPYILFGHSIGAAIILRMIRRLKEERHSAYGLLRMVVLSGRPETTFLPKKINRHLLNENEFIKEVEYYDNFSDEILKNKDILDFFLPIIRNDFHLNDYLYSEEKFLMDKPLVVMAGYDDKDINIKNLEAWSEYSTKWRGFYQFEGNHFYLSEGETFKKLLDLICSVYLQDYGTN